SRAAAHPFEFAKSVSVALGRRGKHSERKTAGLSRGHAIFVGHKLHDRDSPARCERRVNFLQQLCVRGYRKMVQKIRQENQIVGSTKIHIESASSQRRITIGYS